MKRHLALINFSREHHNALILAQILKKDGPNFRDLPSGDEGKRIYTLSFYDRELTKHFHNEEIFFSFVNRQSSLLTEETALLIADHKKLAKWIQHLPKAVNLENILDKIGVLLEKHIRFEERIYFQKVQELFSEKELDELLTLLSPGHSNPKKVS
ncbi:MAG: hemerythrin domain-containing protein [Ignavibacteriaceae bacterium]